MEDTNHPHSPRHTPGQGPAEEQLTQSRSSTTFPSQNTTITKYPYAPSSQRKLPALTSSLTLTPSSSPESKDTLSLPHKPALHAPSRLTFHSNRLKTPEIKEAFRKCPWVSQCGWTSSQGRLLALSMLGSLLCFERCTPLSPEAGAHFDFRFHFLWLSRSPTWCLRPCLFRSWRLIGETA